MSPVSNIHVLPLVEICSLLSYNVLSLLLGCAVSQTKLYCSLHKQSTKETLKDSKVLKEGNFLAFGKFCAMAFSADSFFLSVSIRKRLMFSKKRSLLVRKISFAIVQSLKCIYEKQNIRG
jgi:hypothetical protein